MASLTRDPPLHNPQYHFSLARITSVPDTVLSDSPSIYSDSQRHDSDAEDHLYHHPYADDENQPQHYGSELISPSPDTDSPDLNRLSLGMYGPKMRKVSIAPWEMPDEPEQEQPLRKSEDKKKDKKLRERGRTLIGAVVPAPAKDSVFKGLGFALGGSSSSASSHSSSSSRPSVEAQQPTPHRPLFFQSNPYAPNGASQKCSKISSFSSSVLTPRLRARTVSAGTDFANSFASSSSSLVASTSMASLAESHPPPLPHSYPRSEFGYDDSSTYHQSRVNSRYPDPLDRFSTSSVTSTSSRLQPEDAFNHHRRGLNSNQRHHPYANPDLVIPQSSTSSLASSDGGFIPSPQSFINRALAGAEDDSIQASNASSPSTTTPLKISRKKAPPPPLALAIPRSGSSVTLTPSLLSSPSASTCLFDPSARSTENLRGTSGEHNSSTLVSNVQPSRDLLPPGASRGSASSESSSERHRTSPNHPVLPPSPAPTHLSSSARSPYLSPSPVPPSSSTLSSSVIGPPSPLSPLFQTPFSPGVNVEGVPQGMLSFPGSPAFNLISLEQAQAKLKSKQNPQATPDTGGRLRSVSAGGQLTTTSAIPRSGDGLARIAEPSGTSAASGLIAGAARLPRLRTRTNVELPRDRNTAAAKEAPLETWMPPHLVALHASTDDAQQHPLQKVVSAAGSDSHASPLMHAPAPMKTLRQRKSGFLKFFNKDSGGTHGGKEHSGHAVISSPIENSFNRLPTPKLPSAYPMPHSPHSSSFSPGSLMHPPVPALPSLGNRADSIMSTTSPLSPPSTSSVQGRSHTTPATHHLQARSTAFNGQTPSGPPHNNERDNPNRTVVHKSSYLSLDKDSTTASGGHVTSAKFRKPVPSVSGPSSSSKPSINAKPDVKDEQVLRLRPMSTAFMAGLPADLLLPRDADPVQYATAQTTSPLSPTPHSGANLNSSLISPTAPSVSSIVSLSTTSTSTTNASSTFSTSVSASSGSSSWSPLPTPNSANNNSSPGNTFAHQQSKEVRAGQNNTSSTVIATLREELADLKKAHRLQVWDLQRQIRDLESRLDERGPLQAGQLQAPEQRRDSDDSISSVHIGGIVHRPRARTGGGTRFGSAWE